MDALLDEFTNQLIFGISDETILQSYNYCPKCDVPMQVVDGEYTCVICKKSTLSYDASTMQDNLPASMKIGSGPLRGRYYNVVSDYSRTQKLTVLRQLLQNQVEYTGNAFPINVLNNTATSYNMIQKHVLEDVQVDDGVVGGKKKFVRRGNIKDEVLAGLLYFECIREKVVRKKKDVAAFMKLKTNGFSRGEDILRGLHAEGKIDIPVDDEPKEGFIDRYMETLNLDNPDYVKFVVEICDRSEDRKIGMGSQISSKLVGSLYIIILHLNLPITSAQLEKAADNTKKNTFFKFTKIVLSRMDVFGDIFDKYNIPRSV